MVRWIGTRKSMSDTMIPQVIVAYQSGFGHTATLAESVAAGARDNGAEVRTISLDALTDDDWQCLDDADAIIFGTATYMGNVSAVFQAFAEQTGRRCQQGRWRDKVAAGFTNSGAKSGDKLNSLVSLAVFAAQHHMHWVNLGLGPGWNSSESTDQEPNRLGFWLGAAAATDVDRGPADVHPSDLATCTHLGSRVAEVTRQLITGRIAAQAISVP